MSLIFSSSIVVKLVYRFKMLPKIATDIPAIIMAVSYTHLYTSGQAVRDTIDLLHKLYHVRSCNRNLPKDIGKERPCLNYHIKQCEDVYKRQTYTLALLFPIPIIPLPFDILFITKFIKRNIRISGRIAVINTSNISEDIVSGIFCSYSTPASYKRWESVSSFTAPV